MYTLKYGDLRDYKNLEQETCIFCLLTAFIWVIMGGNLQCIQKHFDDIWGKRPIHCWGKKPMEGLLPQLPFPSTSCTGVFYRLMFVVFSSMSRTYKRKTERACYSQDDLQRALEAVRNMECQKKLFGGIEMAGSPILAF